MSNYCTSDIDVPLIVKELVQLGTRCREVSVVIVPGIAFNLLLLFNGVHKRELRIEVADKSLLTKVFGVNVSLGN
ncbi:hypothetical protein P8452_66472 [Trifolium repens]|nr:hypothetical protein P8452_66472 [Trifolium repens]